MGMEEVLEELRGKLAEYKKSEIVITRHAELQALSRDVDLEEVKENIVHPTKLVFARQQKSSRVEEEKYDCYFAYSKHLYHRYILTVNAKVIIVTIIKINRDWQKAIG
jgi:hypothetical protein